MVILNVTLDNIFSFTDFSMNFSYPKKIVNSAVEGEHLQNRPSFRYKKAIVLMGANSTGKTSFGKALAGIFKFINTGSQAFLFDMVAPNTTGSFSIDFVNREHVIHRLSATIDSASSSINLKCSHTPINKKDTYEKCAVKLRNNVSAINPDITTLKRTFGEIDFRFACPEIESPLNISHIKRDVLLHTFEAIIGTLDPTVTDISLSSNMENTIIIHKSGTDILIRDGKQPDRHLLSSGTVEGIHIAFFLASILSGSNAFYYCDEQFLHIQSEIEKRIFAIMISHLKSNEQLIFTTHNTDMLDLNLPKHSFAFLRKNDVRKTSVIYASDILKRNTDSVRCAVENDMFSSLPSDSLLDLLEKVEK